MARKLIQNALWSGLLCKCNLAAGLDWRPWELQEWKMEMAHPHLPFLQRFGSSSPATHGASSHSEKGGAGYRSVLPGPQQPGPTNPCR